MFVVRLNNECREIIFAGKASSSYNRRTGNMCDGFWLNRPQSCILDTIANSIIKTCHATALLLMHRSTSWFPLIMHALTAPHDHPNPFGILLFHYSRVKLSLRGGGFPGSIWVLAESVVTRETNKRNG